MAVLSTRFPHTLSSCVCHAKLTSTWPQQHDAGRSINHASAACLTVSSRYAPKTSSMGCRWPPLSRHKKCTHTSGNGSRSASETRTHRHCASSTVRASNLSASHMCWRSCVGSHYRAAIVVLLHAVCAGGPMSRPNICSSEQSLPCRRLCQRQDLPGPGLQEGLGWVLGGRRIAQG